MLKDGEKGAVCQRDKKTYAIVPHIPLGVVDPKVLRNIADLAEKHNAAVKITSANRIAIVGLKEQDIDQAWAELGTKPGAAVGLCVRSIKVCPGNTFCRLGKQDSLSLGKELDSRYHGMKLPAKLKIGVSGCINQCAENCIKDIAFTGKANGWVVLAGGNGGSKPCLASKIEEGLTVDEALSLAERIIQYYRDNAGLPDRLSRIISRVGLDNFKKAVLG